MREGRNPEGSDCPPAVQSRGPGIRRVQGDAGIAQKELAITVSVANDPHPFEYHRRSRTDPEEDEREIRYVHILRGLVTRTCRRRRAPQQRETNDYTSQF